MPKDDVIEVNGIIKECFPNAQFLVQITTEGFENEDGTPMEVHGHLSGKMKKFRIRILPGDRVLLELSSYDLTKGRITYREK